MSIQTDEDRVRVFLARSGSRRTTPQAARRRLLRLIAAVRRDQAARDARIASALCQERVAREILGLPLLESAR